MKLSGAFVVMLAAWPIATAVPFRMVDKLAPIRREVGTRAPTKADGTSFPLGNSTTIGTRPLATNGKSLNSNEYHRQGLG
ncbi:unnamed protein product [Clonostachys rosea f. rosea IK726]|uniref:Uncharacterized protein n=1 Tax=Clonostachys rosea f. rosea IK726 TaxID=1349383 RepID=A0ACA9TS89_BIOOC|nr:unnamed protein product [Clonostachys rosea f. rosea IK726]